MIYSWMHNVVDSTCVLLQIISCSCVNETTLFSFLGIALAWKWQIALQIIKKQTRWSNDKTIFIIDPGYHLKYCDFFLLLFASAFDLLATDKSWYFAKPHPVIVKY